MSWDQKVAGHLQRDTRSPEMGDRRREAPNPTCCYGCVRVDGGCTSVCMLGTDPVLPLAIAVLELLGLLGPEPGALLQRGETGQDTTTHGGERIHLHVYGPSALVFAMRVLT